MQWLHFPEGSAFGPLMMKLLLTREDPKSAVVKGFSDAEAALKLGFMEDYLGDKEFILGDKFQAPDIGVTFIANMTERLGEIGPYPKLEAYRKRNLARPGFVRAMERTGG